MSTGGPALRRAILVVPYAYAVLLPLLPLLIELSDVLPRGVAFAGREFALGLAAFAFVALAIGSAAALRRWGWRALAGFPLAGALATLIVTETIAALAGTARSAGAFEVLCQIGDALACAILWLCLSDERTRRTFLGLFLASGIAACAFAIGVTLAKQPAAVYAYEHGRAAGTFLQPNEFAGYLLFLIPIGVAQWAAPLWLRRLGLSAAAAGAVALALSVSRAAVFGLLISLPLLARRFGARAMLGYAVAAALALALGLTIFRNAAHDPSENASRIAVWRGAARMAQRFALVGVGPFAFSAAYPLYKMPDAEVDEVHAHDLALNALIENGVLGLSALAFAVVVSVRAARRAGSAIAVGDAERILLYSGLEVAFLASAVQNSVDLVSTFVFLMWWPMAGLMLGMARREG